MATITLPGVLLTGTFAARPAATTVAVGALYATTDTGAVYQSDGTTWGAWGTVALVNPTTTRGDMLVRNNAGAVVRLPVGAAGTVLHGSATDPAYSAVVPADIDVSADVTTGNATSGHHGFLRKLSGTATDYLDGSGAWSTPAGGGGGGGGGVSQSYVGYNAAGASVEAMANWKAWTKTLVVATAGFLASVQAYVSLSSRSGSEGFAALLWSDNAGQPQTLLALGTTPTLARANGTPRWVSVPLGIWLPAGTYHMGFGSSQVNSSQIAYDAGGTDITFQSAGGFFDDYVSGDTLTTTTRNYSVRGDWISGGSGGSSPRPLLDTYAMDATFGDDFTGASLDAKWTRRTIVSGDEAYQQGIAASYLRVLPAAHGVAGAGYTQPATADGTYAMKLIARNWPVCAFGLAFLDAAGSGLVLQMYNGPYGYLLLDLTTYTSYGGSFTTAGFPAGTSVNQSVLPEDPGGLQVPVWLKVRKSGTSYYPAFSTDGELWSPEGTARVWAGTLNRVAMLIGPLGSANGISSLGYVDIDWFNKIA